MTRHRGNGAWPRAAVFDCDGLLVDSTTCWEQAYASVAVAHGRSLGDVNLPALAGASVATAAAQLSHDLGSVIDQRRLRRALQESFAADPPPALPGAASLVQALGRRMPLAVASNAPRDILLTVLGRIGLLDAFDAIVSAEQTAADKPAPDVYLEACRRLGVAPCDAIAFEDSPLGAQAAREAGLILIAVPSAPGLRIAADLVVGRLNHPQLLAYLGLVPPAAVESSAAGPRRGPREALSGP